MADSKRHTTSHQSDNALNTADSSETLPKNLSTKSLFISACEPSANVHLKALSAYFNKQWRICGIFEQSIFSDFSNAKAHFGLKHFAVMGFFDVIKKLRFFKNAQKAMIALAKSCDVCLLMDSSSFNMPIAKALKASGAKTKVVYYILPQVWAWKPWRAKDIVRDCDYLCAILPFEIDFYAPYVARLSAESSVAKIKYVGHPLLDEITHFKDKPTPKSEGKVAFMPGSRVGEIRRIFPIFLRVAGHLGAQKILVLPKHFRHLDKERLESIYQAKLDGFELSFDTNAALMDSHFAFVCSGTATLESSLIGTPLVLCYKGLGVEIALLRLFVRLKHIGLANILYNAMHFKSPKVGTLNIYSELIQGDLSEANLLRAYESIDLDDFFSKIEALRAYLKQGSAANVGGIIRGIVDG